MAAAWSPCWADVVGEHRRQLERLAAGEQARRVAIGRPDDIDDAVRDLAEQLRAARRPQLFRQVADGVVDIVWTANGYTPGLFPRSEAFELPTVFTNDISPAWGPCSSHAAPAPAAGDIISGHESVTTPLHLQVLGRLVRPDALMPHPA